MGIGLGDQKSTVKEDFDYTSLVYEIEGLAVLLSLLTKGPVVPNATTSLNISVRLVQVKFL